MGVSSGESGGAISLSINLSLSRSLSLHAPVLSLIFQCFHEAPLGVL